MDALDTLTGTLFDRLVWTSAQAVILIAAVALINRLLPRLPSAVRCALWWLVGAQLILGLCWSTPLELPLLAAPAPASVTVHQQPTPHPLQESSAVDAIGGSAVVPVSANRSAGSDGWTMHWRHVLLSIWLAALIAQAVMAIRQWRCARRLLRESIVPSIALQVECKKQARQVGLRTPPSLRLSAAITSPQVTGLWHPVVILPSDQRLTSAEMMMALTHEMAHLRRGDLWLGWIPVIAQRLFFFHPLVTWAMREYALQREAACDEQVLTQIGSDPQAYGQLLLRLGVSRPPHAGLAGASPTFQNLKRRLIMLQQNNTPARRSGPAWLLIALIALIGVLPYRVTAASADQTSAPSNLAAPPAPPHAPPMQPPPAPPALPQAPPPPPPALPHAPPPPPALPPTPPIPPAPPMDGYGFSAKHVYINTQKAGGSGFAIFNDEAIIVTAAETDLQTVKRLRKSEGKPFMWFRQDGKAYVIRDPATVERAQRAYAPVYKLARQQGQLVRAQGHMAQQSAGIAQSRAELARARAVVAQQRAQIALSRSVAGDPDSTDSASAARIQATAQVSASNLQSRERELQARERTMQQEQRANDQAIAAEQADLKHKRADLTARQSRVTLSAEQDVWKVVDQALAKGVAQPVNAS